MLHKLTARHEFVDSHELVFAFSYNDKFTTH